MKSTCLLVVGIAVGTLGSTAYLSNSKHFRNASGDADTASPPTTTRANHPPTKSLWPQWDPSRFQETRPLSQASAGPADDSSPGANATPGSRPPSTPRTQPIGGAQVPSREQLAANAILVEQRANSELARLSQLLDLTEQQQDRIFPLLARSSSAYHPALAIQVGNSADSASPDLAIGAGKPSEPTGHDAHDPILAIEATEGLHDVLTPDQQEILEDALINEDLWWSDIVADLENELDESTQIATGNATPQPEDVGYTGNTGIGALLQQAADESSKKNVTGDARTTSGGTEATTPGGSR